MVRHTTIERIQASLVFNILRYPIRLLTLSDKCLFLVKQLQTSSFNEVFNFKDLSNILTLCHLIRHTLLKTVNDASIDFDVHVHSIEQNIIIIIIIIAAFA